MQELPQNPQLHIKLDFPAGLTERKYARDELRNTTLARIEKELGRSLETDGEKITYLMTDFLGELWKNVQDHAGGQGNYYLEKEYDPLLAQHIVHFIV
ncbi:hypothetical protein KBC03_06075 [Patescibacteria group bacterium]|nr:hypothetical protein [Patescibacteria group bacterium]